ETVPIFPRDPDRLEQIFDGPLPEEGTDPFTLLGEVRQQVLPGSFHLASPSYFGLFNPTPTVIGVFADAVASMINQNMAAWSHGPAGAHIERAVIRWLADLTGTGPKTFGTLTSGGSLANFTGLKVALNEKVPEVKKIGVAAVEGRPTYYVSTQAHYSLDKVADMLGIGLSGMRKIECDAGAKVKVPALERQILADQEAGRVPFCVVGIAGTTTSGAIDPLDDLADVCARRHLWFHVDAAWGGAARMSRRHRDLLKGIERADSVTLDPHKWFAVPFAAGAVLTRDGAALRRTFEVTPHYVSDKVFAEHEDLNLFQFGAAGSRRLDALKVWLSLRQYGRRGYEEMIDRQIALAEYLAGRVAEAPDLEAASEPSLGVMCFRCVPPGLAGRELELDALQMRIQHTVERGGRAWISTSVLGGRRVIRFCATSFLSRERHVDRMLDEVRAAANG
ncbi:MAG TPA: pyridoxal-dependent decarboxylase, partial [Candidatus Polarisedimenticolia bacterium]|nr:pyridoxal-dependent decarboxylase [Candidatus Polarisedimenticolia bacterium]